MTISIEDIKVIYNRGSQFEDLEDFIKQAMVDAFAFSSKMHPDVRDKIKAAAESQIGKTVSIVTFELNREINTARIYRTCSIYLRVRDIDIILFTTG